MQHVAQGGITQFSQRVARGLSRRLRNFGAVELDGFDLENIPEAQVALYFADAPAKLYQLTQWLPVFENKTDVTTIVVVRHIETYNALKKITSLQVLLVPRYEILMSLYDRANFHAVIYVNNGWTNFQSLSFQQAVHVHVNHGESDKICMVSNQAKAYDKVFVAGQAAIDRHAAAIAWFDHSHLVPVGRPQLDLTVSSPVAPSTKKTITYAPTWEGEDEANNYTSLDRYGVDLVRAALAQPDARVVYKPHPRVAISDDSGVRGAHEEIVSLMKAATGEHVYLDGGDILGLLPNTDLLIADVSSVSLDHLYLSPDAPIIITDRRTDRALLLADSPMASACTIIDADSIGRARELIAGVMSSDTHKDDRLAMRSYYFGAPDHTGAGSTERFWSELQRAMTEHDQALRGLQRLRQGKRNTEADRLSG